jgi:hypothetical protein
MLLLVYITAGNFNPRQMTLQYTPLINWNNYIHCSDVWLLIWHLKVAIQIRYQTSEKQVIIRHRVKILFSVISSPITAKVKIVKNERDPPLFTSKQLITFKKILRNTTQVIVRHRICLQTDGRTDMVKPVYPPTTSLWGV